jgi:hypothetical protein
MKNVFIALMGLFLLSGCYTQKKAGNQMVKAHVEYPVLTSFYCNQWYPIRWYDSTVVKYIQGETKYLYDTVEVDCDSVVARTTPGTNTVRIPCPPCPTRIDTFYQSSDKQGESTAALQAERYKTQKCNEELQKVINAATKESTRHKTWLLITGVLAAYTTGRWILRIWGIKLP